MNHLRIIYPSRNIAASLSDDAIIDHRKPSLFTIFPTELREMIWKWTVKPRLVEVRFAAPSNQLHDRTSDIHDFIATIPAILHVCYESRVIGLKYYELAFFHKGCIAPIYFNFEMDSLFPRAACTKRQLEFLARNMDVATTSRIRFLDLYNEHLERARNVSTWDAFPHYFSGLEYIRVLFKSFRDPSIINSAQLPDCVHSALRKPNCPDEAKNDDNPTWRRYQRELLKEKINASLLPPEHLCRYKAKGGSRRTHTLPAELMRWDKRITPGYAEDKVKTYRKNLKKSALAVPFYSDRPYRWTCPDIWYGGLCEHGLVFEAAPGLEFTGKFLNEFDSQGRRIKKFYVKGTVTGNVQDQLIAEGVTH